MDYILVLKEVYGVGPNPVGFGQFAFNNVNEALRACELDRYVPNGMSTNLVCVYDMENNLFIHVEHPEKGLNEYQLKVIQNARESYLNVRNSSNIGNVKFN